MRFRARVEAWFEVNTLDEAQAAADLMEAAAFEALRPIVLPEPERGGLSSTELEPMDNDALAAFAADDLGPGISSARFEPGSRDSAGPTQKP
jgi:hypothetical protein